MRMLLMLGTLAILSTGIYAVVVMVQKQNGTSIKVTESTHQYKLAAAFAPEKSVAINRYIDSCLSPAMVFNGKSQFSGEIALDGTAGFRLDASPGSVELFVDKDRHSDETVEKIKRIARGIISSIKE